MPQKLKDTKSHKAFIANAFIFVGFSVLVPWWREEYFSEWTQKVKLTNSVFGWTCYVASFAIWPG